MERLRYFVEGSLGLLMLLFGYCNPPMPSNEIINQFVSSPCNVSCGLLSFLFIPEVLHMGGYVSVFVGLLQIISLYFSTVLAVPLSVLFKFSNWITNLFGRSGGGGGGIGGSLPISSSNFSLSTAIACIAIGALLAASDSTATAVASSVASILSGLLLSGMAFVLTTAARSVGIQFCGG